MFESDSEIRIACKEISQRSDHAVRDFHDSTLTGDFTNTLYINKTALYKQQGYIKLKVVNRTNEYLPFHFWLISLMLICVFHSTFFSENPHNSCSVLQRKWTIWWNYQGVDYIICFQLIESQLYAPVKQNGDILGSVDFEKQLFKHLRLGSLSEQCSFMV